MVKKFMFLFVLSSILLALVWVKSNTANPVFNMFNSNNEATEYKMVEYKIINITDNQYFGKSEDGTEIHFSGEKISSDNKIQVEDEIICYFEKDDLADGVVKVVKK